MTETREWVLDEAAAEFYEQHFVPAIFAEWGGWLVDAAALEPGERVLDVACGTGAVTRAAADRVGPDGRTVGLDLNASMIGVARRVRPRIEWHVGDAGALPFDRGEFDAVLSQAALMFMPDREAALREMRRVLREGGRAAVQVWGASPGYDRAAAVLEEVAGAEAAAIFRAPFVLSDREGLAPLFRLAGFEEVRVETRHGEARFPSLEDFVRTEIEGWVFAGKVDVGAFLDAVRDPLKDFVDADGALGIPLEGHIVLAS